MFDPGKWFWVRFGVNQKERMAAFRSSTGSEDAAFELSLGELGEEAFDGFAPRGAKATYPIYPS